MDADQEAVTTWALLQDILERCELLASMKSSRLVVPATGCSGTNAAR
jgi:hypothetical protein